MSDVFDEQDASPPTVPDPSDESIDELLEDPPKWPTVVGTISIVWAGLTLTCSGCGVGSMFIFGPMMQSQAQGGSLPPSMQLGPVDWLALGLGLSNAALLLAAGITLTMRNYTSRILHIFYGLLAFPLSAFGTYLQWGKQAQMAQWAQDNPNSPFAQGGATNSTWQVALFIFLMGLGLAWPVFCLVWFGLVKNKRESLTGGVEHVV